MKQKGFIYSMTLPAKSETVVRSGETCLRVYRNKTLYEFLWGVFHRFDFTRTAYSVFYKLQTKPDPKTEKFLKAMQRPIDKIDYFDQLGINPYRTEPKP